MSCERFSDSIVDHACGADLDVETAAHVQHCAGCRRKLDDVRRGLVEAETELREALALSASADFVPQVLARTAPAEPIRSWTWAWWTGAAAAASIAFSMMVNLPRSGQVPETASHRAPRESIVLAPERPVRTGQTATAAPAAELRPRTAGLRNRPASASRPRTVQEEPLVLVAPDQARAIARLRELVRSGALDDTTVPSEATAPTAVLIAPLSIPELSAPNSLSTAAPPSGGTEDRP